jgi:hypothetical protein
VYGRSFRAGKSKCSCHKSHFCEDDMLHYDGAVFVCGMSSLMVILNVEGVGGKVEKEVN